MDKHYKCQRSLWPVALLLALTGSATLGVPSSAFADDPDQDSAALSAETDAALYAAGQQADKALTDLMADRLQSQGPTAASVPSYVSLSLVPPA